MVEKGGEGGAAPGSSPRPTFSGPTAIAGEQAARFLWGDDESGEVADWIYASTDKIHMLVFALPPGGECLHSDRHRTIFGADVTYCVLQGTLVLANPQCGEVRVVEAGEAVLVRRDTWQHYFAHTTEQLRVLEFFAPPPSTGTSRQYAQTRPMLEESRYADDNLLGAWPNRQPEPTLHHRRPSDFVWRRDGNALVGIVASTEHLTVGNLSLLPGTAAIPRLTPATSVSTRWRACSTSVPGQKALPSGTSCIRATASTARREQPIAITTSVGASQKRSSVSRRHGGSFRCCRDRRRRDKGRRGALHAVDRSDRSLDLIATEPRRGGAAVLADCVALAAQAASGRAVGAVGVGVCELVDCEGAITSASSFDWRGLDVGAAFSEIAPVRVESDVRAAALAESVQARGAVCTAFSTSTAEVASARLSFSMAFLIPARAAMRS